MISELSLDSLLRQQTKLEDIFSKRINPTSLFHPIASFHDANKVLIAPPDTIYSVMNDNRVFVESNTYGRVLLIPPRIDIGKEANSNAYSLAKNQQALYQHFTIKPSEKISFSVHPRHNIWPPHRHDYIEILYVYSGQCRQVIEDIRVVMEEGDICFLDMNTAHYIIPGKKDIIIQCLARPKFFDSSFIFRLSENKVISNFLANAISQKKNACEYILFHSRDNNIIRQMFENMLCRYFLTNRYSEDSIKSYLNIIFHELSDTYSSGQFAHNHNTSKDQLLSDIVVYIQNNCKSANLNSTAKHFCLSPTYLSRKIKEMSGSSFINLLQEARIREACFLLRTTDMPITEISHEVGYANTYYFYQLFEKYLKCTPGKYRDYES